MLRAQHALDPLSQGSLENQAGRSQVYQLHDFYTIAGECELCQIIKEVSVSHVPSPLFPSFSVFVFLLTVTWIMQVGSCFNQHSMEPPFKSNECKQMKLTPLERGGLTSPRDSNNIFIFLSTSYSLSGGWFNSPMTDDFVLCGKGEGPRHL